MSLRRLLPALACGAALAAAAAATPAQAAPGDAVLQVEITGIHVVDWTYVTGGYPDECQGWTKGSGTQTTGIRTVAPIRYDLFDIGFGKLLSPDTRKARFKASAERSADWTEHRTPMTSACTPCGPLSEYGKCEEPGPDVAPLFVCRRQTPEAMAMLQMIPAGTEMEDGVVSLADVLVVTSTASPSWTHCPPDFDGSPISMHAEQPLEVRIVGAKVQRLMNMRKGQKLTLKGDAERGFDGSREAETCKGAAGQAYHECAVTDMTVEVRRVR